MNTRNKSSVLFLAIASLLIAGQANASIIQLGTDAIAYTDGDIAIGDGTRAQGGMAQGQNANAYGSGCYAMALGRNANASCVGGALGGSTAIGFAATAGYGAIAVGDQANARVSGVALGNRTIANDSATAVGTGAIAGTFSSTAIGAGAEAGGDGGYVAINGRALGLNSIAIGGVATHTNSITLGVRSTTSRDNQVSVGRPGEERVISNVAAGTQSHDAVIHQQVVPAITGIVSGLGGGATYNPSTGVMTAPSYVLSMGTYNNVGDALVALDNKPGGGGESPYFKANGGGETTPATATTQQSTAGGVGSNADGEAATTYGYRSSATQEGTAVGAFTSARARCDAFGYAAECDENDTTSFGREGDESRLVRVAAGINPTDAANVGQVAAITNGFGGGANFNGGVFTPPNYVFISGASYNNVGSALADLDSRIYDLEQRPPSVPGAQGPAGDSAYQVALNNGFSGTESEWLESLQGEQGERGERGEDGAPGEGGGEPGRDGRDGTDGSDGRSAYEIAVEGGFTGTETEWLESLHGADGRDGAGANSVAGRNIEIEDNGDGTQTVSLSDNIELTDQGSLQVGATTVNADGVSIQGGPSMTREGIDAGGQRVTSVAAGRIERGSTDAVNGGQIYDLQNGWNDRWVETNTRVDRLSDDIQAVGAQSAAMSMMTGAGTYLPVGKVAVSAGVGFYGNKTAFAVGLKARSSERSSWSIGIAISPDGKPMGGVGYSLTFD